jgi:hypothetical protein
MRAGRHRIGHTGAERREKPVGRRDAERPLERGEGNVDAGRKLTAHPPQIEIDIFDLALREILWQQTGAERAGIVKHRPPSDRTQPVIANLDDVAGHRVLDGDRADDRMRTPAGIGEP